MWNVKGVLEKSVDHVLGNFGIALLRDPIFRKKLVFLYSQVFVTELSNDRQRLLE
jgi:hypothetical protein